MSANAIALESFRHNAWATRRLIDVCRPLTAEQLEATGVGTFGDIPRTLEHIVLSDGSYARGAATYAGVVTDLDWVDGPHVRDLDVLDGWSTQVAEVWEQVLATDVDVDREIPLDGGAHASRLGVLYAQAINHANHHREQVCAILTGLGLEAPDIQAWEYGWRCGRVWDPPAGQAERATSAS
jgi:uncharacterized damage-inducible protein DinB